MRFIMNGVHASTHAPEPTKPQTFRRTPQTRRRTDLPDTTTITVRNATERELLKPIFEADPNRSTHYLPPKLKGRILR